MSYETSKGQVSGGRASVNNAWMQCVQRVQFHLDALDLLRSAWITCPENDLCRAAESARLSKCKREQVVRSRAMCAFA